MYSIWLLITIPLRCEMYCYVLGRIQFSGTCEIHSCDRCQMSPSAVFSECSCWSL